MTKVKCLDCGHEQLIKKSNVYQDINGKYTACEDCGSSYDIEYENVDELAELGQGGGAAIG